MGNRYYIDTCIYLNLWQKEVINGIEIWRLAKEFFDKVEETEAIIYYSGFVLKELNYILTEKEFNQKKELFNSSLNFKRTTLTNEEYEEARKIEIDTSEEISFYDIMHILLARKTDSILITRDNKMTEIAHRLNVEAKKPEDVL